MNTRPIGVWCYDKNTNELIKPEDWNSNNVSGGIVVVTEEHAFRILPNACVVKSWGAPDKDTELCRNEETISGEGLTDRIIETYKGIEYKSDSGNYNFIGSPAAEFCKSVGGYLPTIKEIRIMVLNQIKIQKCCNIMNIAPLYVGWYWTCIEESNSRAYIVDLFSYNKNFAPKETELCVQAIVPFEF